MKYLNQISLKLLLFVTLFIITSVFAKVHLRTQEGENAKFGFQSKTDMLDTLSFGVIHNSSSWQPWFTQAREFWKNTIFYRQGQPAKNRLKVPTQEELENGSPKIVLSNVTAKDDGLYYIDYRPHGVIISQRNKYNLTVIPKTPPKATGKPTNETPPKATGKPTNVSGAARKSSYPAGIVVGLSIFAVLAQLP